MLDWIASNSDAFVSFDYSKVYCDISHKNCDLKPYNPYKLDQVNILVLLTTRIYIFAF